MVSRLAKWQVLITLTIVVLLIVFGALDGHWSNTYSFDGAHGFLGIILLILGITSLVIGIMQIVYGIGEGSVLSIVAGIFGILSIYAWLAIAALIMNIILWVTHKK